MLRCHDDISSDVIFDVVCCSLSMVQVGQLIYLVCLSIEMSMSSIKVKLV